MAEEKIKPVELKLEDFFSKVLSAIGKTTDEQIAELLKKTKTTIATAESMTGGLVSARLTNIDGASEYFIGGSICYHNRIKVLDVGVPASVISRNGAVSREAAIAMAEGIRKHMRTDVGLAVTGSAGPKPLPPAPVGQTFIALASDKGTEFKELQLQGTRMEIREKAAQALLGLLWLHLGGQEIMGLKQ